ncbi:hypothetical protein ACOSQ3_031066 [Xanthoceras sorbifolium]
MEVVASIIGAAVTETGLLFCGFCPNIKNFHQHPIESQCSRKRDESLGRYRLSMETARMLEEVERLLKVGHIAANMHFGMVIWATLSKKLDLKEVQIQLAERLKMEVKTLEVTHCPNLHHVLSYGDSGFNTETLEEIKVSFCYNLEELVQYVPRQRETPVSVVPKLRIIELKNLVSLTTICKQQESWPSLEQLEVINCNALWKLPLAYQNANTKKEIRGERIWLRNLKWDNDYTKTCLQHCFRYVTNRAATMESETWT